MMTNIEYSFCLIQKLVTNQVQTFCICPSARNAPLMEVLFRISSNKVFQFFDERSAAFFALGRSKRDQQPVAVVTTSGTAVCELYPALVEAYYSNASLTLVTADRPLEYKGTGAPQCIEQVGIFSKYVDKEWDLQVSKNTSINDVSFLPHQSTHINVRFDEPLVDQELPDSFSLDAQSTESFSLSKATLLSKVKNASHQNQSVITSFFQKSKKPVVILSELPISYQKKVESFFSSFNVPLYAEPSSQLRESTVLYQQMLKSGNNIFSQALKNQWMDGVIRIGGIPVNRFWRDLNQLQIPILSFSLLPFSGLKNKHSVCSLDLLSHTQSFLEAIEYSYFDLLEWDQKVYSNQIKNILSSHALSEPAWVHYISKKIPSGSYIFLGNSLPIREWDVWATRENKNQFYFSNRGANGIDGLLSSFFGLCKSNRQNYCVIGDLSTLYDLSAPWVLSQLKEKKIHIIVINNFGGQIFKGKFQHSSFINHHQVQFKNWANMWSIAYQLLKNPTDSLLENSPALTEIQIFENTVKI